MSQTKKKTTGKPSNREMSNTLMLLLESTGRNVHLETHDGSYREGKLTSFDCRAITVNGRQMDLPIAVELNGDYTDHIPLAMIAKLDID